MIQSGKGKDSDGGDVGAGSGVLLGLRGFGVAFGSKVMLAEVNLELPERGVAVVLGPGGVGKSTLIRTLCGANLGVASIRTWGEVWYRGAPLIVGNSHVNEAGSNSSSSSSSGSDAAGSRLLSHRDWGGVGSESGPSASAGAFGVRDDRPMLVYQNARLLMATVWENLVIHLPDRSALTRLALRDRAVESLRFWGLDALADRLDECVVDLPLGWQRCLAVVRTVAAGSALVCVDEPTADLPDEEAEEMIRLLGAIAKDRGVMVVTHHLGHARALGGRTILLANGRVMAHQPADEFFEEPAGDHAQAFVRHGCCPSHRPDLDPEELDPELPPLPPLPPAALAATSKASRAYAGPNGFRWVRTGYLAGTSRPGLLNDLDQDLNALQRLGVTVLVCLMNEMPPVADADLARHRITGLHFPIPDMEAPAPADVVGLFRRIDDLFRNNAVVAFHCRAGLGRTGTLLAAYLIWQGIPALEALENVRQIESRYVQSNAQVQFLEAFAADVQHQFPARKPPPSGHPEDAHNGSEGRRKT